MVMTEIPLDDMYILISSETPVFKGPSPNDWGSRTEWYVLMQQSLPPITVSFEIYGTSPILPPNADLIMDKLTIYAIPPQAYTGQPIEPAPSVWYDGVLLTNGIDYNVEYADNIDEGEGMLTFTFNGMYAGISTAPSCVESYEIRSGSTQPFEMLDLRISQRRLAGIVDNVNRFIDGITPSRSQIMIYGYGGSTRFIVSNVKIRGKGSDRVCTITAYGIPQIYQSSGIKPGRGQNISGGVGLKPSAIIKDILFGTGYGTDAAPLQFEESNIVWWYDDDNDTWDNADVNLKENTNVWRALQICALKLGAKIWFEGEKAYIIDFRLTGNNAKGSCVGVPPEERNTPMHLYRDGDPLSSDVIGTAEISDDGLDMVVNSQKITSGGDDVIERNDESIYAYGDRAGSSLSIPEFASNAGDQKAVKSIAKSLLDYRADMQRSIAFSVKEVSADGWKPYFEPVMWVAEIHNELDGIIIDNRARSKITGNDNGNPIYEVRPQLLYLSEVTRKYPQGYSTYTFGKIVNVDLAQAFSELTAK